MSLSIELWPLMICTLFYINHGIPQESAKWNENKSFASITALDFSAILMINTSSDHRHVMC